MEGREELVKHWINVMGEEGCTGSCDDKSIIHDEEGWKLFLCTFMEPWYLGKTVDEAKASQDAHARMGFGLSA